MARKTKYLRFFPAPLLEDLIAGLWFPVVGAGLSRNAVVPPRKKMPLWNDLGDALSKDLSDYSPAHALDSISAFEHEFGRAKLVERLAKELLIDDARPGEVHKAFCSIPFSLVCTTNFDFLLERQYDLVPRACTPLIDETQLSITLKDTGTALLKLHGDLRHPDRMVVTEGDYEIFIDRFPLLATYLASLLISRTAVLIGYSLDDPDFRQVWAVVTSRLGKFRRPAYAILVNAGRTDISRFERRGVKVINLVNSKESYGKVLADAFAELADHWKENMISVSAVRQEEPLRELSLPPNTSTVLSFFAVPISLQSFYRERVFPVFQEAGFVPTTADDVVSPGDVVQAKIEAILDRSFLFVVDISTQQTLVEWRLAKKQMPANRILIIAGNDALPFDLQDFRIIRRPDIAAGEFDGFIAEIRHWVAEVAEASREQRSNEPARLLAAGEFRAAVIAAISMLEIYLRKHLKGEVQLTSHSIPTPLRPLVELAQAQGLLMNVPVERIREWMKIRNNVVHSARTVTKVQATEIVQGVTTIVNRPA